MPLSTIKKVILIWGSDHVFSGLVFSGFLWISNLPKKNMETDIEFIDQVIQATLSSETGHPWVLPLV